MSVLDEFSIDLKVGVTLSTPLLERQVEGEGGGEGKEHPFQPTLLERQVEDLFPHNSARQGSMLVYLEFIFSRM